MKATDHLIADPASEPASIRRQIKAEAIAYTIVLGMTTLLLETLPGGRLFALLLWVFVLTGGVGWLVYWLHATADGHRPRMQALVRRLRMTVYSVVALVALLMAMDLLFDVAGATEVRATSIAIALIALLATSTLIVTLILMSRAGRVLPTRRADR